MLEISELTKFIQNKTQMLQGRLNSMVSFQLK